MNYFDEKRAAQATAYLLKLAGGRMNYMKLIKLLYLADRQALAQYGFTITSDNYVSMNNGLVLSNILNLIHDEVDEKEKSLWSEYISDPFGYDVSLNKKDLDTTELSEAEVEILEEIFSKFGSMDKWALVEHIHHRLKEWKDPHGSMIPVSIREILDAISDDKEDNEKIAAGIEAANEVKRLMSE